MKTVCKIFIILSMVALFWTIIPIIVGAIALSKLESATSKSELTGVAICTLLFCSTVAGVLMLCISDEDLRKDKVQATRAQTQRSEPAASGIVIEESSEPNEPKSSAIEEASQNIEKLKQLKEQGILSEEEYERLRKREVEKMMGD